MLPEVGLPVAFELNWNGVSRWQENLDTGGCGLWEIGKVISLDNYTMLVQSGSRKVSFPLPGHKDYDPGQWSWRGYVRHKDGTKLETPKEKFLRCVCGAAKVYGTNAPHSSWCDLARG